MSWILIWIDEVMKIILPFADIKDPLKCCKFLDNFDYCWILSTATRILELYHNGNGTLLCFRSKDKNTRKTAWQKSNWEYSEDYIYLIGLKNVAAFVLFGVTHRNSIGRASTELRQWMRKQKSFLLISIINLNKIKWNVSWCSFCI